MIKYNGYLIVTLPTGEIVLQSSLGTQIEVCVSIAAAKRVADSHDARNAYERDEGHGKTPVVILLGVCRDQGRDSLRSNNNWHENDQLKIVLDLWLDRTHY